MIFSGKKGSEASSDSVKVAIFPERRKRRQALSDGSGGDWSDALISDPDIVTKSLFMLSLSY